MIKYEYGGYETFQSIVFILIITLYSTVSGIPWSYYYHFILEEKHGFNKQVINDLWKLESLTVEYDQLILYLDDSIFHQRYNQENNG